MTSIELNGNLHKAFMQKHPSKEIDVVVSEIISNAVAEMDDATAINFLAQTLAIEAWTLVQTYEKLKAFEG